MRPGPKRGRRRSCSRSKVPRKVTTQPQTQNVWVGEKMALTAACSGYPAPSIVWEARRPELFNDEWLNIETTGGTISFEWEALFPATEYRARCSNSAGTVYTEPALLTVGEEPTITLQPVSVTVPPGGAATFKTTCKASPTGTIQWEYLPPEATQWRNWTTGTETEFVAPTTEWSGTQWRATCSNGFGKPAVSNVAVMKVGEAPKVATEPVSATVTEPSGTEATFTAACTGSPAPAEEWEYLAPGSSEWIGLELNGPTLKMPALRAINGWQVRLHCSNVDGSVNSEPATLTVEWIAVEAQPSSVTVSVGALATFTAGCGGLPAPGVQWYRQGGTPVEGATSTTLQVPVSSLAQTGEAFYAQCQNEAGTADTVLASMTVEPRPTVTKLKKSTGPVTGGTPVTITGTGFSGASGVSFGGVPATGVEVRSATEIKAVAPAVAIAGSVNVTVARYGAESLAVKADSYKYTPLITRLEPSSGATGGGTIIQVYGKGFSAASKATTFKIGTSKPVWASCYSTEGCEIDTPAHAAGKVEIKVTVNKAAPPKNPAASFTYE